MRITTTAPAKLVLAGEYVVLDGEPALVAAVDRRASVVAQLPREDQSVEVLTDLQGSTPFALEQDANGRWPDDPVLVPPGARLVAMALAQGAVGRAGVPGSVYLATAALHDASEGVPLGLGSSAALATCTHAALARWRAERPGFELALALHRAWQGASGSGVDVAAAFHGGVGRFRRDETTCTFEPLAEPSGVAWRAFWTGTSVSTPAFLSRLWTARTAHPAPVSKALARLAEAARQVIGAWEADDAAGILSGVDAHHDAMAHLGAAIDAPIVDAIHARLADAARAAGCAWKPSGAGGGDVGIAFARDADTLIRLAADLAPLGARALDLAVDPDGLLIDIEAPVL